MTKEYDIKDNTFLLLWMDKPTIIDWEFDDSMFLSRYLILWGNYSCHRDYQ